MRFSIIIPVYKVEKYITQCISSVLRQDFSDYEIILVNDGSPDGSAGICRAFAEKDSRIRLIEQKNAGLSAARNNGIRNACGEYLIFLDSDDYWLTRHGLTYIDRQLREKAVDAVFWKHVKVDEGHNEYVDASVDSFSAEMCIIPDDIVRFIRSKQLVVCAWDVAVSRRLFDNGTLDFEEGVNSEDVEWLTRLITKIDRCVFADMTLNGYRIRGGSITKCPDDRMLDDLNAHYRLIIRRFSDHSDKTVKMLKVYLGEQAANYILALVLSPREVVDRHKDCEAFPYLKYCVTPRAKTLKWLKRLIGLSAEVFLIKKLTRR